MRIPIRTHSCSTIPCLRVLLLMSLNGNIFDCIGISKSGNIDLSKVDWISEDVVSDIFVHRDRVHVIFRSGSQPLRSFQRKGILNSLSYEVV